MCTGCLAQRVAIVTPTKSIPINLYLFNTILFSRPVVALSDDECWIIHIYYMYTRIPVVYIYFFFRFSKVTYTGNSVRSFRFPHSSYVIVYKRYGCTTDDKTLAANRSSTSGGGLRYSPQHNAPIPPSMPLQNKLSWRTKSVSLKNQKDVTPLYPRTPTALTAVYK